jgi:hypothetical protein
VPLQRGREVCRRIDFEVRIFTIGICNSLGMQPFQEAYSPSAKVLDEICAKFDKTTGEHADLVVNCTTLKNPSHHRHIGAHCDIFADVIYHPKFPKILQDLRKTILEMILEKPMKPKMTLVFFCNHGRHRSVAMGLVTEALLKRYHSRWLVKPVRHVSRRTWGKICHGDCAHCAADHPKKLRTIEKAAEIWELVE